MFFLFKRRLTVFLYFLIFNYLFVLHVAAANYYINSRFGTDSNNGISMETPWKSFANLQTHEFMPGDSILFAKGSAYSGGFSFKSSGTAQKPIVFSSYSADANLVLSNKRTELTPLFIKYGAGPAPTFTNPEWKVLNGNIFRIEGSYIIIDGLYFHDNTNPPGSDNKNKNVQKLGVVYFALGTGHNTVKNCEFFHSPVAVKIKGMYNLVTHNYMHDAADTMANSWGPVAIMIVSKHNEISYNKVINYGSYGGPYGSDGGAVELDGVDNAFNATDINIHHNICINNHGFMEMAGRNIDSVTVAYNLSDDRNQFLGGGSAKNIVVLHNTIIRTREPNVDRYVFWTFDKENTHYMISNNLFVIAKDIHVFGPYIKPAGHVRTYIGDQPHNHNLYFSPGNNDVIGIAPGEGDIIADPLFIDAQNGNYRLKPNSPAKYKGTRPDSSPDLDGAVTTKKFTSIGAYN
jgi:hypothetical protein